MHALIKTYGRGLTVLFVALVAAWVLLMILVPGVRTIQRAFIYEDRAGETAMIAIEIDRAYTEKFQLDQEAADLHAQAEAESAPSSGVPSFGAPSMGGPTIGVPGAGPSGGAAARLSPADRDARLAEIAAKVATLEGRIADLEAREDTSSGEAGMKERYSFENFTTMSMVHVRIFVLTLFYALCVTVLSFLICYPVAFVAATTRSKGKLTVMLLLLVIPYAINELLRIFSWVMILEKNGILNSLFDALGFIDLEAGEGIRFVASNGAVFLVMVYAYVLFMVFPIYNTIDTLDPNQLEAARDLGASSWRIHTRVVIPHAKPGIAVGAIMTFMLSAGSIAAPEIVGRGLHPDWFSQLIYRRFFEADSWNQGSAYSLALLVACVIFIFATMRIFKVGIRDIAK
ncbi:ABC transporter permease [Zavarzinia compransoris]|uniref:ABC transporter permease n=1 Tax=Zavarzinia marina TaxID=2911065 RepID=UPI001F3D63ED|nr:ABC transporter permease [Zavarzinia marina]MCF4164698.1 ABC transporter permease [Zavarzinia marina]